MSKIFQFGETVTGYDIPVLNEREIRAGAGIFFLIMIISFMRAILTGEFVMIKYAVTMFLIDLSIRVFVNPKFSPVLIIGRMIVRKQTPLYVGAKQKRFAWSIGVVLVATIFVLLVIVNGFSPISGFACMFCLTFLFLETAFGICLGCKIYALFFKNRVQYCPGEVCEKKERHDIQKVSKSQLAIVFGFIGIFILAVALFKDIYQKKPYDLFNLYHKTDSN